MRQTPNGNTHCRLYSFCIPYTRGHQQGSFCVPVDDEKCWSFSFATVNSEMQHELPVDGKGGLEYEGWPYDQDGKKRTLENDYLIDRDLQRNGTIYTGIQGRFNNQDVMARQTSYTDRTKEHLGTLDRKIILMRRILINAAKNLERGIEPPAIDPSLPYDTIGQPDRLLLPDESWTRIGTPEDPNWSRLFARGAALEVPPLAAR